MEIIFKKPRIKPTFQAEIYRSRNAGGVKEYRAVIGRYGSAVPPKVGEFVDYHAISDFLDTDGIKAWVNGKVEELDKEGKKVAFDESPSYLISRLIEELAAESPVRIPTVRILKKPVWYIKEAGAA